MSASPSSNLLRHALLILLLVGFVVLVTRQFTDFTSLVRTASRAKWQWLVVAIGLHGVYLFAYALLYGKCFSIVGVAVPTRSLLANYFASIFINAVAPLGGAGSAALFIDDAVSRRQSGARTAAGVLLTLILDLVTALPFIGYGVVYLAQKGDLALYDVVAVAAFAIFIGLLIAVLALSYANVRLTRRVFRSLGSIAVLFGRIFHRPGFERGKWAIENASQFSRAARGIASAPGKLLFASLVGLVLHVVNLAGLCALFVAFEQAIKPGVVLAGFGLSIVYFVVTILEGVGVVEYVMTLVFALGGVPRPSAIAITLAYRGLNFWIPLLIGLVFVSRAPAFHGDPGADAEREADLG